MFKKNGQISLAIYHFHFVLRQAQDKIRPQQGTPVRRSFSVGWIPKNYATFVAGALVAAGLFFANAVLPSFFFSVSLITSAFMLALSFL